ncbi:uncharacterized protein LOC120104665 [Phoenix dactylifera]|uniref:Uncharacterized protein LOC120104665 n=1 Tax=Phoenix dactylifera TaxID=42345 RepID=A0A8B8ZKV3_PHODC|nr:uncharacterized protein LOC120104665 [Phoenix dactylifera]
MEDEREIRAPSPDPDSQSISQTTPHSIATQADLAGVYQLIAQLLEQQQQMQLAAQPVQPIESYYERFRRLNPPMFNGGSDPMIAEAWIRELEKMYELLQFTEEVKVKLAISMLRGSADSWWTAMETAYEVNGMAWGDFKRVFYAKYFSDSVRQMKQNEFLSLTQSEHMTVSDYVNRFDELGRFCPQFMEDDMSRANRFEQGLRHEIRSRTSSQLITSYMDILDRALRVEAELKRSDRERADLMRSRSDRSQSGRPWDFRGTPIQEKPRVRNYSSRSHSGIINITIADPKARTYSSRSHSGPYIRRARACYSCGRTGHLARDCPYKRRNELRPPVPGDQRPRSNARVLH